jgi:hypothetical protein
MFNLESAIAAWRQKMLAAGIETPVPLEELEIHLREDVERQLQSGVAAEQAFALAVQRLGEARTLTTEFKNAGTMNAPNHQRIYDEVIAAYALFSLFITVGMIYWPPSMYAGWSIASFWMGLARHGLIRSFPRDPEVFSSVPPGVILLNLIYVIAMVATLLARRFRPQFGAWLTRLLNWALLPALPLGTLIGLYGLWYPKFQAFKATVNSWLGKWLTFRTMRATGQNSTTGERLVTACCRIIMGGLIGRLGCVVLQHGFEVVIEVVLAPALPQGVPPGLIQFSTEHIVVYLFFPIVVLLSLLLGSFLLWCAWLTIRSAWSQAKTTPVPA